MGDKIIIDKEDLIRIADTVRLKKGSTELLSLFDIFASLEDNLYLIVDEAGNELFATFTEQPILTDATANDIRLGKTAVTENGLVEGEKEIPAYHTTEGVEIIQAGKEFRILIRESDRYNYTKMQAIICPYNKSLANSVSAEKVCINNNVYVVGDTTSLSTVTLDHDNKEIVLGITNDTDNIFLIRYFTYKEE